MLTDVLVKLGKIKSVEGIYLISPNKNMDLFVKNLPVKVQVLKE